MDTVDTVAFALQQIGVERPSWQTVVVSAAREAALPRRVLWDVWGRLEDWPRWSAPLHVSTRWTGAPGWRVGATFEQVLDLGFPLGRVVSPETVGAVVAGERVSWWHAARGVRACHVWDFASLAPDRTLVTDTEVFHGVAVGLLKPLAARRWQRLFESSVAGLVARGHQAA